MRFKDLTFKKLYDGVQSIVKFGKDYELSIVKHSGSYGGTQGLYEIAVFDGGNQIELPGITQDNDTVKGYLTQDDVNCILIKMTSITGNNGV